MDRLKMSLMVHAVHSVLQFKAFGMINLHYEIRIRQKIYIGNALAWVQRVHEPADLWDIAYCTRYYYVHPLF